MARALPVGVRRYCRRDHPRSILPRQRRQVDPRTRPRPWNSFSGNYSSWLEQKLERLATEKKQGDARQRTLARELEWVRMGAKARQAKGKARLSAYERLLAEATDDKAGAREFEIAIPPGPRLGDKVIDVANLRKGYGETLLIEDLTFSLPRAGIVGIIGPNGAGKTTLFRMLVGQETPDGGSIAIGDTVVLSYVDQERDALAADKTVFQEIAQGAELIKTGAREVPARAYVSSFNFRGTDQQKLVGQLSGGERSTGCTSPSCCRRGATCCCSTNRPTTSTSTRCERWRPAWSRSRAASWSFRTTDGSWTGFATHILAFEGDLRCGTSRGT